MFQRYIADKLIALPRRTASRYLKRWITDDQPMRQPYNDRYSTATGRCIDRYIDRQLTEVSTAISVSTPPIRHKIPNNLDASLRNTCMIEHI